MNTIKHLLAMYKEKRKERKEEELRKRASELYQLQEHDGDIWLTFSGFLICPETCLTGEPVNVLHDIRNLYIKRNKK